MPKKPSSPSAPDRSEGDVNSSSFRAAWQRSELNAATREVLADDARWFLRQSLSTPCLNVMAGCSGSYIEDLQGRKYLDFHGNSVHQVGFGHPHVIDAIKRQLDVLPFCTRRYTNQVAIDLARRLASLAPGDLNKVLFAPGGAEAISMALKLARLVTGRHKTISMWDSFHGATLDAISIGGEAAFRKDIGPLLPGTEHVPPPDAYRCLWDCHQRGGCDLKCEAYLEYVLEREGDIAAVIAEPLRSTPYIPPVEYWKKVRAACDRHGTLLILDEIYLGLGRTGRMFACQHYDIVPDILVLGKGLGGGVMPLACMIAREGLDQASDTSLGHFTHEKNPVSAAAAMAVLDVLDNENLVQRAEQLGNHALERLRAMAKQYSIIGEVRGIGLMLGVELVTDRHSRTRACDAAERVMYAALTRGVSFKLTMGNILQLVPPLTISEHDLDRALDIIEACIADQG